MRPPTPSQIDYVLGLAYQTGHDRPELPRTEEHAGAMISHYKTLPKVRSDMWYLNGQPIGDYDAWLRATQRTSQAGFGFGGLGETLVKELRKEYKNLPLDMIRRMVYIFGEVARVHL